MSDIAIRVDNLWKQYRIGLKKSTNFRESMTTLFSKEEKEYFWALKEIDFEVKTGEAVGIIGKNGAGKSTLLKVLSRITYPTKGRIELKGRVSSLLEVGTGFHPELTGRQNIFLNGTILGMSRSEIKAKFDEIVAFSGVEKFIDTPVKRYSSGMKVRLAFSVAAHLEPEILIIDEVLAVGDAEFQRKCLGKMEDVAGQGRTVLFVSHNMSAVEKLCNRAIILKEGKIWSEGSNVVDEIGKYLADEARYVDSEYCRWIAGQDKEFDNEYYDLDRVELTDTKNNLLSRVIPASLELSLQVVFKIKRIDSSLNFGYAVYKNQEIVYWSWMKDTTLNYAFREGHVYRLTTKIPSNFLTKGEHEIEVFSVLDNIKTLINRGEGIRIPFEIDGTFASIRVHPKFDWELVDIKK